MTKGRDKGKRRQVRQLCAALDQLPVKDALDLYDDLCEHTSRDVRLDCRLLKLTKDDLVRRLARVKEESTLQRLRRFT